MCIIRRQDKSSNSSVVFWIAGQLPAVGFFKKMKAVLVLNVFDIQLLNRGGNFRLSNIREFVRRKFIFRASIAKSIDNLVGRERFLRAKKKRFDDASQIHVV